MITKVSLKNFKLHADTTIEAAPITVFIGPNNSGKSSIFQALLSLRQAASHEWEALYDPNRYRDPSSLIVDIGEFNDVKRHGEREIRIETEGTIPYPQSYAMGERIRVCFEVCMRDNSLVFHSGVLETFIPHSGGRYVPTREMRWHWARPSAHETSNFQFENTILHFGTTKTFRLIQPSGLTSTKEFTPQKQVEINEIQQYLGATLIHLLNSLHPIFSLRGFEEPGYPLPAAPPWHLYRLGLADRAIALASTLLYKDELAEQLSSWLEGLLGVGIKVKVLEGPRLTIRTKPSKKKDSGALFLNEGTGASQLPFILIPIGLAPENETILLCEPEAHLHPYGQSELMKLLLKVQKDKKLQYFIETHSEHILHALLHAVAKGELEQSQLAIYYFKNEKGVAQVEKLDVDERGGVKGGLPGFFDQALDELTEYLDALKLKKT